MNDNSISKAIKHLEDLKKQGYLNQEQFLREVKDLMSRVEAREQELPPRATPGENGQPQTMPLEDLTSHSDPRQYSVEDTPPEASPTLAGLELEYAPEPDPEPIPQEKEPPASFLDTPPLTTSRGRVIIKGKAPWDDKGEERVNITAHRKQRATDVFETENKKNKDSEPIKHAQLASMAKKTIKKLNQKKNPQTAFFLSFLFPGMGQLYVGQGGAAIIMLLVTSLLWVGVFFEEYDVLYILAPYTLLAAAILHKQTVMRNYFIDRKKRLNKSNKPKDSSLNVDKSVRRTNTIASGPRGNGTGNHTPRT